MDATDNPDEFDPITGLRRRIMDQQSSDPVAATQTSTPADTSAPAQFNTNDPAPRSGDTSFVNTSTVPQAPPAGTPGTYQAGSPNDPNQPAAFNPNSANINDPNQLSQLISWAASQPGVNPSVARDPGYWQGAAARFNGDTGYFIQRMFTPEGPPEGSGAAPAGDTSGGSAYTGGGAPVQQPGQSNDAFSQFLQQYQAQQAQQAAEKAQVRAFLLEQLKAASAPVNESDANIAAPLSAARDETARATDTERTALAERLYAQGGGLNSNALTQGIQQSSERNAGTLSSLRSTLISNEYNARRTQMTQLLSQALASGNADAAQQIQVQMAALDAALKREGLGVGLAEFGAQLNQNAALAGIG